MCLFCSMTRRQVFRGLTAAAVGGGVAQRVATPAIRPALAGAAGFAVLAAVDASPWCRRAGHFRRRPLPLSGGRGLGRAAPRVHL